MLRKHAVNRSQLARDNNVARSTLERVLSGETKNPRQKTVRILREAGLLPMDASLLIPENVRAFAIGADLRYIEVEALLRSTLKPVVQMKPAELAHVLDSARKFPDLYGWAGAAIQG